MAFMIGGDEDERPSKGASPFAKKPAKKRAMIGGPDEEEEAELAPEEEDEPMDAEAQKLEAARLLFPDNPKRALKALEAFFHACSGE